MSRNGTKLPNFIQMLEKKEFLIPKDVSFASLPNGASDLDAIANSLTTLAHDAPKWCSSKAELERMLRNLQLKTEQI